jgi:hypothetical protein
MIVSLVLATQRSLSVCFFIWASFQRRVQVHAQQATFWILMHMRAAWPYSTSLELCLYCEDEALLHSGIGRTKFMLWPHEGPSHWV